MSSKLRTECVSYYGSRPALSYRQALQYVFTAVSQKRTLIRGKLRNSRGGTCAMGACWDMYPRAIMPAGFTDEVAAINDSVPSTASARERWRVVRRWLQYKLRTTA